MKRVWLWAPLAAFILFFAVVMSGLIKPDDRLHASQMVGKPLPQFALAPAASSRPGLSRADLAGRPRLLNVFASWCVPCIAEAPVLAQLAAQGVEIDGVAIRDRREDVDRFLGANGNPYRAIGLDPDSSLQIAIGSSGVPETFVIDARGVIRHQHIGDINAGDIPEIMSKLAEAGQ